MADRWDGNFITVRAREYVQALGTSWTYALHRNPYAVAGLLWGLPIPVVSVVLVQWASGGELTPGDCCEAMRRHPVLLVLAAHPLVFAVLFGAFGTIWEQKERRIRSLIRHLEVLAESDGLTGLYNQRHFQQTFPLWVERSARAGRPLALALIDLDGLKAINDTHGHVEGNLVLQQVARLIIEHARPTDLAARTGGDEFALLMPDTTAPQALGISERIRERIAAAPCLLAEGKGSLAISISVGVAAMPAGGCSPEALLGLADRALYRAKSQGRNRVAAG